MSDTPRKYAMISARRRGSVLVLVLGVTSIVGIIGLSALLAVRLQHRDVQTRADAMQAQQLADGALQLIHARLDEDLAWRSNHTHDTWTTDEDLGGGSTMRYKLVDEDDADLDDDNNDPARLVIRVAHGEAVRLASIQLTGGTNLGPELVTNGDMEAGTAGYAPTLMSSVINASTANPHAGSINLILQGRLTSLEGWKQNLSTGSIESGKTYRVSVWIRLPNSAANIKLGLYNAWLLGTDTEERQTGATTQWQNFQFDLTPSYSFSPTSTYVYAHTASGTQDIHFDDLSVREVLGGESSVTVIRGSYRRELDD